MKFEIEFKGGDNYGVKDGEGNTMVEMPQDVFVEKLKKHPKAEMVGIVCIKTNSGIVIIGGRPYYIP